MLASPSNNRTNDKKLNTTLSVTEFWHQQHNSSENWRPHRVWHTVSGKRKVEEITGGRAVEIECCFKARDLCQITQLFDISAGDTGRPSSHRGEEVFPSSSPAQIEQYEHDALTSTCSFHLHRLSSFLLIINLSMLLKIFKNIWGCACYWSVKQMLQTNHINSRCYLILGIQMQQQLFHLIWASACIQ